jgi:diacylglycerol kinase
MSYITRRLQSAVYAWQGVRYLVQTQPNAKIHLLATIIVVIVAWVLRVDHIGGALLTVAVAMVWVAEAINTAVERTVDLASPEYHKLAGQAKDVAAGAVLLASIFAFLIGAWVFLPRLQAQI